MTFGREHHHVAVVDSESRRVFLRRVANGVTRPRWSVQVIWLPLAGPLLRDRASDTQHGTRVYLEASPATVARVSAALAMSP